MNAYRPHDILIEPARSSASLMQLGMGLVVMVVAVIVLNFAWFGVLVTQLGGPSVIHEIAQGTTVRGMALLLGSFSCMVAALWLALALVHGRSLRSLLGPRLAFVTQGRQVLKACVILYVVLFLVPSPEEVTPERAMDWGLWLRLLPLSLGLLILQCGAEELVFRGYLQSQLAARFRSPLIWMVLPSLLFGVLHYDVEVYGDVAIWLVIWAVAFGLVAADLTARTGTLAPAIVLHVVNNFVAMSLAATNGYWDGLALYTFPFGPEDTEILMALMPVEGGVLLCAWLAARVAVRR
ncbi:CPBP family intramembrane glutamic endopeptidase [Shimia abyssi]|uniref:CAAX prenyl protease 2/Lysostaphin resistance protein A-like domain-containing protein n=1 Tax=Shimia abyssi TaxID=1662395 RepID=A0A2P8FHP9_9RHOB|nr:CPBP family intramembrane glutamic endopeptidase [Shimia abyssi]PSL21237.1 hypothetical protein CLV88_102357 [Shimia abyssi]